MRYKRLFFSSLLAVLELTVHAQHTGAIFELDGASFFGGSNIIEPINSTHAVTLAGDSLGMLVIVPIGTTAATLSSGTNNAIKLDPNMHINDISVIDNTVFACGWQTTSGTAEAWYGYATLDPSDTLFMSNMNIYKLSNIKSADKIVAYRNISTSNIDVAIACHSLNWSTTWGLHHLLRVRNATSTATSLTCDDIALDTNYRLFDLVATDDFVVATGEHAVANDEDFILRFRKVATSSITADIFYLNRPDPMYGHYVSCTSTTGNNIAISYYTLHYGTNSMVLKIIDVNSSPILNTFSHRIDIVGKIDPPRLTFIPTDLSVVMLFPDMALPAITPLSTFVCIQPFSPAAPPARVYYDIGTTEKYYDVATLAPSHFMAAMTNRWLLQNEMTMVSSTFPARTPCYNSSNIPVQRSNTLTFTSSTKTTNIVSVTRKILKSRTTKTISKGCYY